MYTISNRIEVPVETREAFEKAFIDSMRDTLAGVPGLHRSTLMRPERDGLPYVSTMEFDSRSDFIAWIRSDSFRHLTATSRHPVCRPRTRSSSTR